MRWCVVGGGILGLDAARRLSAGGAAVTVWESAGNAGGLASPWRIGDYQWDRFYHVIAGADASTREMLADVGLESEIRWVGAQTGFYTGGRLHRFSGLLDFLAFPALDPLEKFRLGTTILRAARVSDGRDLERITAVEWLTRLSGRGVVRKIWLPLLRAKLGDDAERVNASFMWTIIKRMYGARSNAAKRECFGYVPGGYARILASLTQRLVASGIELQTGAPVERIDPLPGGGLSVRRRDGVERQFDGVLVTVPAPAAAAMCTGLKKFERDALTGVEYQGVACASLLLRRPLSPYYITNITDPAPFTAVIEMDALTTGEPFGGNALVYLPKYAAPSDPIFDLDDDAIVDSFVDAIIGMYPGLRRDDVVAARVAKARYVLPVPTLRYSDRVAPIATSIPGLFVANSSQIVNGTLNVNQTLELAQRAAGVIAASSVAGRPLLESCA